MPGTYNVSIKYKDHEAKGQSKSWRIRDLQISDSDRKAKFDAVMRSGKLQETAAAAIERIINTKSDIDVISKKVDALEKEWKKKNPDKKDTPYKALANRRAH